MDLKMKFALACLGMLTIYSLPLFSLIVGAMYVFYLNRKKVSA
ncbi:hypothetical protein [Enterococcus saccharolyticus]|uniref:Uncharacterized protein n=1 Tax=Enterococcus saccharolyticus subsp. saccharolyticus ATCC 43076 TaxID=1139996 RepID=S0N4N5_9ENTE|nr:hypothetical protein [Enterococcus saccharolyticus]EOT26292.1 hypothetical protein OMQ_02067 [Enterococcus saccharolyticus subsp. saccharolyticus ATCC 43076]EOT76252.1 hypothetical protein I572_02440 [Enterococcus saccharolyticus subsp. saccharolyticus ATCC 43076]OJG85360.1 hypothetical protein RV16_GL001351 [Enterococcus saccharolyticus]